MTRESLSSVLRSIISGDVSSSESESEESWRRNWLAGDVSNHEHLAVAMIGGAMADRLSWVFHAGYQGMMRYAFFFCPKDGWSSYLVAEDKSGEFPGTGLDKSGPDTLLKGNKSWVAASKHVDHLVVQVVLPDENILVVVDSDAPGVSLSHREKPGFLSDLSQGFATFTDVAVADIYKHDALPENFSQSEPHHVLTALNTFMISHTVRLGGNSTITDTAAASLEKSIRLVDQKVTGDHFFLGVAELDSETTATAQHFADFIEDVDESLHRRWRKDSGLVNMFSRGLQKRAAWLRDK